MNSVILITFDSLRLDVAKAALPDIPWETRTSWASWTLPSHLMLAAGLLPYRDHSGLAIEHYREQYAAWSRRFGVEVKREPEMWLPTTLRRLGIRCGAVTAMPCLNTVSPFSRQWRQHITSEEMDNTEEALNIAASIINDGHPWFWMLNLGCTHYPFGLDLPHLSGMHGDQGGVVDFDAGDYFQMGTAQSDRLAAAWPHVERLIAGLPKGTTVIVTSDHGELLGEDGLFGHGPFLHEVLYKVPYWEVTT